LWPCQHAQRYSRPRIAQVPPSSEMQALARRPGALSSLVIRLKRVIPVSDCTVLWPKCGVTWNMKARVIQRPTLSSSLKEVQERLLGLLV
jgi:hypothetical protein